MTNPNTNFCDWANSKEYGDISDLSMSDDEVTGYRYMDSFYIVEYKEDDHVTPEMQNTEYVVHIGNTESNFGDDLAAAEMFLWDEFARFELNWKHVSFDTEFGTDYQLNQKQVMDLIDAGFIDASWHNDICPSFDLLLSDKEYEGAYIRCWFDAPEVEHRETEDEQFAVVVMEGGDTLEELVSTNNFLEAMAAVRKYRKLYSLRKVRWTWDADDETFDGFTDDTHWNGWLNVQVDTETHCKVIDGMKTFADASRIDYEDSGVAEFIAMQPDEDTGLYDYGNCYCTYEDEGDGS